MSGAARRQSKGNPLLQPSRWTSSGQKKKAAEFRAGRLPVSKWTDPEWTLGDVEAGFKKAALILDETFITPNTSHQCLESRTSLAYWKNGKLYIHLSTPSTVQTVMSVVRWLELQPENVVVIAEYCGGGYGAKGTGTVTDIIPALLSKKTGTPVQMRISREEEHSIGGARPALHGRLKVGSRTKAASRRSTCSPSSDKGAQLFNWEQRVARSGQRNGSKVRGSGVAVSSFSGGSIGFDGLFVIKPDGRMYIHSVDNLGTESFSAGSMTPDPLQ